MPICFLWTSLARHAIPKQFEKHLSEKIAEVLSKPTEGLVRPGYDDKLHPVYSNFVNLRMHIILQSDLSFCRNDTYDPALLLEIRAIDVFNASTTPKFTKSLTEYLSSNLTIPKERITLQYVPLDKMMVSSGF